MFQESFLAYTTVYSRRNNTRRSLNGLQRAAKAVFRPSEKNVKAKICFDVCRLIFDFLFACSMIFFDFTPALVWCEKGVTL